MVDFCASNFQTSYLDICFHLKPLSNLGKVNCNWTPQELLPLDFLQKCAWLPRNLIKPFCNSFRDTVPLWSKSIIFTKSRPQCGHLKKKRANPWLTFLYNDWFMGNPYNGFNNPEMTEWYNPQGFWPLWHLSSCESGDFKRKWYLFSWWWYCYPGIVHDVKPM